MQEKPGVATRLLYQLYFSLERKRRTQMSGTVMEITQPAAIVGLHKKEHEIYYDVRMYVYDMDDVAASMYVWYRMQFGVISSHFCV